MNRDSKTRKKREGEEKLRADEIHGIFQAISDPLFVMDKNRIITKVNKSTCNMFMKKPEELIGKHCYEIFHGINCPWPNCPATKTFQTKQSVTEEISDPNLGIPLLVTTSPIFDEQGEVAKVIHIAKDITAVKLAETELHIAANLFDAASDAILVHDLDGKLVYFNEAAYKTRGFTRDEFQGLCTQDLEVPDNPRFFGPRMEELLKKGEATFEAVNLHKDKTVVSVEIHARVIESEGRKLVLSVARDISERKKVEEKLKESEEKYQTTFESSMDALMLLDQKSFLDCNRSTLQMFGFKSVEEFVKNHPADLSPSTQPNGTTSMNAAISHIQKAFQTGTDHFFWIHSRTDGTTFPADVLLTRMILKDRDILQATVRDLTELKKAEEEIKFQAYLLNHVGQAIIMVDNNRIIRFWNNAAEKLYGWSEEQALGHKVTELLGVTSPEEADGVSKKLMAGESWSTEVCAKNKDGSVVPVILNRTPIYNENGQFVGATSITTDITLQKNTENDLTFSLNSLSTSLNKIQELNEKLRVVGGLTRHDVRNKLTTVTGYAYIIKKRHGDQADIVDGLTKMELAIHEIVKIFDFAKMYEQIGAEDLIYINVGEKLNEATALFSGSIPTIINECRGLTVLADSFLRQLFFNFIDNTRKHGKKTTIIRTYFEKNDQDSLKLIYEDDGVGVPFENKTRLFKEGFSTGGSTGFGLFLTKKMIDVYGWEIKENGEPGTGAKFTITIPKTNQNGKENFQIAE